MLRPRITAEEKIWSKFIPQDEVTVQSKIIEERNEEIQQVCNSENVWEHISLH
jgi:hypothetical protein